MKSDYLPIDQAPIGTEMFVAVAIDISPTYGILNYTTDPYVVWQPEKGEFKRWPHPYPPTHFYPIPSRA